MNRITFLGLGAMGRRMAARLLAAGFDLTVYNRTASAADALIAEGARLASSPRAAVEGAEVVISMVTDDEAAKAIWLDPERGAIGGLGAGAIAIESSTLTPETARAIGAALTARGARYVDAPVAGTLPQAAGGTLNYLIGGDAETVDAVRPVLAPLAAAIHHIGAIGQGMAMKLAINAFFAIETAALAEAAHLATRGGVDKARALEVLTAMPVVAPALAGLAGQMAAGHYTPFFPVRLVAKDLRYAAGFAERHGGDTPLARAAHALYVRAAAAGHGEANISAVDLVAGTAAS